MPTRQSVVAAKVGASDPDGSRVTLSYHWLRDGSVIKGWSKKTINLAGRNVHKQDHLAVRVTATAGGVSVTKTSPALVIRDSPPHISALTIAPRAPLGDDTLTANLVASDPDHDTLTEHRTWSWTCPGSLSGSAVATSLILTDYAIGPGCQIGLSDRVSDGHLAVTKTASTVTIGDQPPTIGTVTLTPSDPTANQVVTASANTGDPDGTPVTTSCAWTLDSVAVGTSSCQIDLVAIGATHGQTLAVTMTTSDGTLSAEATASTQVADRPPVINSVAIDFQAPQTNDTVNAVVDASDPDGDPVQLSYQWSRNGDPISGATGAALDLSQPGNGDLGDQISVAVSASDGTLTDTDTSSSVTIADSAPTLAGATINYDPITGDASIDTSAADPDNEALTTKVRWAINGVDAGTGATIDLGQAGAHLGDTIDAYVKVTDPEDEASAVVAAAPITIDSGLPAASELNIWQPLASLVTDTTNADMSTIAVVSSDPNKMYATDVFDFFSSTDGGVTWQSTILPNSEPFSIAYDPSNPSTVYVGTIEGQIMKSEDSGATWQTIYNVNGTSTINGLAVDPNDGDTVYAATNGFGLLRSTDGGRTWDTLSPFGTGAESVNIDPTNNQRIIVSTSKGVTVSSDGGATWSTPTGPVDMFATIDPTDPANIWAIRPNIAGPSVLESTDDGATWTTMPNSPARLRAIAVRDGIIDVGANRETVAQSGDGGATWQTTQLANSGDLVGAAATVAVDPTNPYRAIVGLEDYGPWAVTFSPDMPQGATDYVYATFDSITDVTPTSATINGTVMPYFPGDGANGNGWLEWQWGVNSPTENTVLSSEFFSGPESQQVSTTLTGLTPNTTYHLEGTLIQNYRGGFTQPVIVEATFTTPPE